MKIVAPVIHDKDIVSKEYIDEVARRSFVVVDELPVCTAECLGKIYLVKEPPVGTPLQDNIYDEYIAIDNGIAIPKYTWEKIGSTDLDLDKYVKKDEINEITANSIEGDGFVVKEDRGISGFLLKTKKKLTLDDFANMRPENKGKVVTVDSEGNLTLADSKIDWTQYN